MSDLNQRNPSLLPEQSRYVRNTWMISAESPLILDGGNTVRYFNSAEANNLSEMIRKRNVYARHSWENNFYITRTRELENQTIIEVFKSGDPKAIREDAAEIADLIEKIVLISATLEYDKEKLLKKIGIHIKHQNEIDIIIGYNIRHISSRQQGAAKSKGIALNQRFINRFNKCGFSELYNICLVNNDLTKRLLTSMDWLFESRIEPQRNAATIKTSIAMESLLIFNESEPLKRSLSERVAFLLSSEPDERKILNEIIGKYYDERSAIVHGNRKVPSISSREIVERLLVLMYLTISKNPQIFRSVEQLRKWLEAQRWGYSNTEVNRRYLDRYIKSAITLYKKNTSKSPHPAERVKT